MTICATEALEHRAVTWLAAHGELFDPEAYKSSDRYGRAVSRKALVDLSTLLVCRLRFTKISLEPPYQKLLSVLVRITSRPSWRNLIPRHARSLWLFGLPYAALYLAGRDDAALRSVMTQTVAIGLPATVEKAPYRHLDHLHFLRAGNLPHSLPTEAAVFPLTLLGADPNPLLLSESDAYAICHSVLYMTDFGQRQDYWPARYPVSKANYILSVLLEFYHAEEQLDLVAELLAAMGALGVPMAGQVSEGLSLLVDMQRADGSLVGPLHLVSTDASPVDRRHPYPEWLERYHTTIVAALAALIARGQGGSSPIAESTTIPLSVGQDRIHLISEAIARCHRWLEANGSARQESTIEDIIHDSDQIETSSSIHGLILGLNSYDLGRVGANLE
ncbi:MAG: DUF6895 family protein, partial [Candidatus Dormibacteraceae bacterium]